jgi:phage terminase large subunit
MATAPVEREIDFPEKLAFLFEPHRYKIAYGGRYGVKSWSFARALLMIADAPSILWPERTAGPRILCCRETQKSIAESVHQLLSDQIHEMGLEGHFNVNQSNISARNGADFIFAGIRQNVGNLKSYEGCDICWVEEAQTVSKNSWNVLIPTIRKEGSEIWASFNPDLESDETYQRFVVNPPASAKVVHTTFRDNAWLSNVMKQEMADLKRRDPIAYEHVYEGLCKQAVEGAIYRAELTAAELNGRLTKVPYDAQYPVHTFWDLGFGDNTSIWFAQSLPFEFRIIDHESSALQSLHYYIERLQDRPYVYGTHYLPWDGAAKELGSGRSIQEQLGKFYPGKVVCARKLSVTDGIAAVRAIFPMCIFDREKCADGLQSLRHYRYERDEKLGTLKREPLHDWASHDADAFRTLAVAIRSSHRPEQYDERPSRPPTQWS